MHVRVTVLDNSYTNHKFADSQTLHNYHNNEPADIYKGNNITGSLGCVNYINDKYHINNSPQQRHNPLIFAK